MEEESGIKIGSKLLGFIFAFMFLYIAISYLGAPTILAVIISIGLLIVVYGFMELTWGKHLAEFLKKQESNKPNWKYKEETKIIDVKPEEQSEPKRQSQ